MPTSISILIVGIVITVFCGTLTYILYQKESVTTSWPSSSGVITKSNIVLGRDTFGSDAKTQDQPIWRLEVTYSFTVSGIIYSGNRISLEATKAFDFINSDSANIGKRPNETQPSQKLLTVQKTYAVGNKVTVHYNPANPKDCVLELETSGYKIFGFLALAGLLISLGALIDYFIHKKI